MADSFSKKEKEKKRAQKKKEKLARKESRKEDSVNGNNLDSMMAYVDENGVIVDTPPDQSIKKKEIKAKDIELGVPKREDVDEDPVHEGKVTFYHNEKGYGFIKDKNSQESYFVHMNNCMQPIAEGDKVQFELEKGPKGWVAVKVKTL